MRMNDLYGQFSQASRRYEIPMRNAEDAITKAQRQELKLSQEIATCLQKIASVQIDENPALDADLRRQIQLRGEEEQTLRQDLARTEAEIEHLSARANALAGQMESLERSLAGSLEADPNHAQILKDLTTARDEDAQRAVQYREILDEVDRKEPAFKDNELMMYLVRVGYGTDAYARRGLFRYLDRWIAGLCNFDANRPSQIMLADLRAANEEQRAGATSVIPDLNRRLQLRRQELEEELGLPALRADLKATRAAVSTQKDRANTLQDGLAAYRAKKDSRYLQATEALAAILNNESPDELVARVRQTPSGEDDGSLSVLFEHQHELDAVRVRIPQLKAEYERTRTQYQRAKELEREVRSSGVVTKDHDYRDVDVDALVTGYVLGSLSQIRVLDELEEHKVPIPRVEYDDTSSSWGGSLGSSYSSGRSTSSGSSSSRRSDDSSWGSSSSGSDGFSTSSSDGGGSYSTSDSF